MKTDIDSILLANCYFTLCRLNNGSECKKTDLARKFLNAKINKALSDRISKKIKSDNALIYFD